MNIKFLLASVTLLLLTMTANAVPAKPVKKTVRQADGTLIELTLRGIMLTVRLFTVKWMKG